MTVQPDPSRRGLKDSKAWNRTLEYERLEDFAQDIAQMTKSKRPLFLAVDLADPSQHDGSVSDFKVNAVFTISFQWSLFNRRMLRMTGLRLNG